MWIFVAVGVLWIATWIQGVRYDRKDRQDNEIVDLVENKIPPPLLCFGQEKIEQLRHLRDFIHAHYPGAEIRLVGDDDVFDPTGWERVPLTWQDLKIYIKRPEVWDERKFSSA